MKQKTAFNAQRVFVKKRGISTFGWILFAALALPLASRGAEALQFVAQGFSAAEGGAVWRSVRGDATWQSAHLATNGWGAAVARGGAVWFDGGSSGSNGSTGNAGSTGSAVASPLQFADSATDDSATNAMRVAKRIFAVVVCAEAADFSTLIDAPCPVAFEAAALDAAESGVAESVRFFSTNLVGHASSLSVNGEAESEFALGMSSQLVEAEFDAAAPMSRIFIGGSAAVPSWNQNWRGGIRELIFLPEIPSEREAQAVRRYLALKHSMRIPTEADGGVAGVLAAMGIDDHGLFSTVILAR